MLQRTALALFAAALLLLGQPGRAAADAQELHIVLVVDTNASKRGGEDEIMRPGMEANLKHLTDVINEVYNADERFKGRMFLNVIKGDDVTLEKVRKFFTGQPYNPNRAWLFFYCGHGATDPKKGHYFAMSGGDMLRSDVYHLINDTGARGIFLFSDCCSSYADFQPPQRRVPAKWKVFYQLFYQTEGVVNFTAASESQFGWVNSRDGGMFTRAFVKFLCEPASGIRKDGEDGPVTWDDFFGRVRDTTDDIFQDARNRAPEGAEIKKSDSQVPQAFHLGGWPTQYRRQLVVKNDTNQTLCVWVMYYDLNFSTNEWEWYYPTKNGIRYELKPGASNTLRHDGWLIGAHRLRIWAATLDGRLVWERYKTEDLYLTPKDGYRGPFGQFTFTFNP
jgi:hypothetical protein